MKNIFLFLSLCIITGCASRSNLSYTTKASNTFYEHVYNTVVVKSNRKRPIEVIVDNGGTEILPIKENDSVYSVKVKKVKEKPSYLILKQNKKIEKIRIRINEIPSPHINFVISNEGFVETREMTAERYNKALKLTVMYPGVPFDFKQEVTPFDIIIISKDNGVSRFKSEGNGVLPRLGGIKSGDIIVFSNIGLKLCNACEVIEVKDFVLTIL